MKNANFEKLKLKELQEERIKTKKSLSLGLGATVAFILVFIVIFITNAKYFNEIGTSNLLGFFSGLFMFFLAVSLSYNKLKRIDKELNKRG